MEDQTLLAPPENDFISKLMESSFVHGFTTDMLLNKDQAWDQMDRLEAILLASGGTKGLPPEHTFTNGLYVRTLFMPAGMFLTSEIHNTQHQFFVLQGSALVWTWESNWQMVTAPRQGITEPGTRRILYIYEDMLWATVHPWDGPSDPKAVMDSILNCRKNPYIEKALSL